MLTANTQRDVLVALSNALEKNNVKPLQIIPPQQHTDAVGDKRLIVREFIEMAPAHIELMSRNIKNGHLLLPFFMTLKSLFPVVFTGSERDLVRLNKDYQSLLSLYILASESSNPPTQFDIFHAFLQVLPEGEETSRLLEFTTAHPNIPYVSCLETVVKLLNMESAFSETSIETLFLNDFFYQIVVKSINQEGVFNKQLFERELLQQIVDVDVPLKHISLDDFFALRETDAVDVESISPVLFSINQLRELLAEQDIRISTLNAFLLVVYFKQQHKDRAIDESAFELIALSNAIKPYSLSAKAVSSLITIIATISGDYGVHVHLVDALKIASAHIEKKKNELKSSTYELQRDDETQIIHQLMLIEIDKQRIITQLPPKDELQTRTILLGINEIRQHIVGQISLITALMIFELITLGVLNGVKFSDNYHLIDNSKDAFDAYMKEQGLSYLSELSINEDNYPLILNMVTEGLKAYQHIDGYLLKFALTRENPLIDYLQLLEIKSQGFANKLLILCLLDLMNEGFQFDVSDEENLVKLLSYFQFDEFHALLKRLTENGLPIKLTIIFRIISESKDLLSVDDVVKEYEQLTSASQNKVLKEMTVGDSLTKSGIALIDRINQLIRQYNASSTHSDRIIILQQLDNELTLALFSRELQEDSQAFNRLSTFRDGFVTDADTLSYEQALQGYGIHKDASMLLKAMEFARASYRFHAIKEIEPALPLGDAEQIKEACFELLSRRDTLLQQLAKCSEEERDNISEALFNVNFQLFSIQQQQLPWLDDLLIRHLNSLSLYYEKSEMMKGMIDAPLKDDYQTSVLSKHQNRNQNFIVSLPLEGGFVKVVVRVEDREDASLDQYLQTRPYARFFSEDYVSVILPVKDKSGAIVYRPFVISQFANEGDLNDVAMQSIRLFDVDDEGNIELLYPNAEEHAKLCHHYLKDIFTLCFGLFQDGVMNPDIKPTNFLSHDGELRVADRKTFTRLPVGDPPYLVNFSDLFSQYHSTPRFFPPEVSVILDEDEEGNISINMRELRKHKDEMINLEAFKVYQLGYMIKTLLTGGMESIYELTESYELDIFSVDLLAFIDRPCPELFANLHALANAMLHSNPRLRISLSDANELMQLASTIDEVEFKQLIRQKCPFKRACERFQRGEISLKQIMDDYICDLQGLSEMDVLLFAEMCDIVIDQSVNDREKQLFQLLKQLKGLCFVSVDELCRSKSSLNDVCKGYSELLSLLDTMDASAYPDELITILRELKTTMEERILSDSQFQEMAFKDLSVALMPEGLLLQSFLYEKPFSLERQERVFHRLEHVSGDYHEEALHFALRQHLWTSTKERIYDTADVIALCEFERDLLNQHKDAFNVADFFHYLTVMLEIRDNYPTIDIALMNMLPTIADFFKALPEKTHSLNAYKTFQLLLSIVGLEDFKQNVLLANCLSIIEENIDDGQLDLDSISTDTRWYYRLCEAYIKADLHVPKPELMTRRFNDAINALITSINDNPHNGHLLQQAQDCLYAFKGTKPLPDAIVRLKSCCQQLLMMVLKEQLSGFSRFLISMGVAASRFKINADKLSIEMIQLYGLLKDDLDKSVIPEVLLPKDFVAMNATFIDARYQEIEPMSALSTSKTLEGLSGIPSAELTDKAVDTASSMVVKTDAHLANQAAAQTVLSMLADSTLDDDAATVMFLDGDASLTTATIDNPDGVDKRQEVPDHDSKPAEKEVEDEVPTVDKRMGL